MVGLDGVGNILQHHSFAGARRCNDQSALPLAKRRHQIQDTSGGVLYRRIIDFKGEAVVRIKRRQIIEIYFVPDFLGRIEIDRLQL